MVVEHTVLNQVARRVPKARPINAKHTVAVLVVLNQIARRVPLTRLINVWHTVVEHDAQIA
jgi:hypothetical protein